MDEATCDTYAYTKTASVSSDGVSDIDDLREAIREKYRHEKPDVLEGIVANQLSIYANRAVYEDKNGQPLEEDSPIGALSASKKDALIVIVPTQDVVPRTVAAVAESIAIPAAEPTDICVTIQEVRDAEEDLQELTYYQRRGRLIRDKCQDFCAQILDKVDEFYHENELPIPFICVEGSSGMGKSQLAFALGGRRPWYYWLATTIGSGSQCLYRNFTYISDAFGLVVEQDNPKTKNKKRIY